MALYNFKSLEEIAAFWDKRAQDEKEEARRTIGARNQSVYYARAAAYSDVAETLRASIIEPE